MTITDQLHAILDRHRATTTPFSKGPYCQPCDTAWPCESSVLAQFASDLNDRLEDLEIRTFVDDEY